MQLDFMELYNNTMEQSRLFRRVLVDYAQEPNKFAAYTDEDQHRIRQHMATIAQEHQQG